MIYVTYVVQCVMYVTYMVQCDMCVAYVAQCVMYVTYVVQGLIYTWPSVCNVCVYNDAALGVTYVHATNETVGQARDRVCNVCGSSTYLSLNPFM